MNLQSNLSFTLQVNNQAILIPADRIVEMFNQLYYAMKEQTWENTYYMGRHIIKCPLDLWVYQEIFYEVKPDLIIETGTFHGGAALYYANVCDIIQHGQIVTIDIDRYSGITEHPRITYINGSSTSRQVVEEVESLVKNKETILVILDSDHMYDHVLQELYIYSKFVTQGSYMIVEDTNINGHPVRPEWGPGPMEALEEFLRNDNHFEIDANREKFMLTINPKGYLKKIRSDGSA
jgi:cephalosporin hydroxylase